MVDFVHRDQVAGESLGFLKLTFLKLIFNVSLRSTSLAKLIPTRFRLKHIISTRPCSIAPEMLTSSSTSSSITARTSTFIPPSTNTSRSASLRCWRCGGRTMRSSFLRVRKHSRVCYRMQKCRLWTVDTSRWKIMLMR